MVTRTEAIKIAEELIKKRIHGLAVEANLHVRYQLNSASGKKAAEGRDRLREALIVLERIKGEI